MCRCGNLREVNPTLGITELYFSLNYLFKINFMPSSETMDCYFENGLCGWTGENDWKIESTVNNGIEK